MNKTNNNIISVVVALVFLITVIACDNPNGNNPGTEYMPDMGHSIAYEANHYDYYSKNTWGTEEEYHRYAQPRKPVKGTIPRGYAGTIAPSENELAVPTNGSVPYHYADTEEERTRASNEIQSNPFPITAAGLEVGKNLYNINCGICHGGAGKGEGWLYSENNPNAKYPAAPANFLTEEFINASPGRYYHAIIYGKNVMGGYADKLSYEERWQVIHYIRALQAAELKLVYTGEANTLNNYAQPMAVTGPQNMEEEMNKISVPMLDHSMDHGKGGHHKDDGHGHGENHSDSHDHSGDDH